MNDDCDMCYVYDEYRCATCCNTAVSSVGCYCGWCISNPEFLDHVQSVHGDALTGHNPVAETCWSHNNQGHWKDCRFCDETEHRLQTGTHTFDGTNTCTVCGFKKGTTFSGSITSFGTSGANLNLKLIPSGSQEPIYEAETGNNNDDFSFSNVEAGSYIVRVSKENHVTRDYKVTVGEDPVNLDVKLCLKGDVNEEGSVNYADIQRLYQHIAMGNKCEDYGLKIADINEMDGVNYADIQRLYQHIATDNKLY